MSEPGVIGARGSHDALRRVLSGHEPCKVLDAPCGTGVLAEFLRDRGWQVHCADIDPGNFQIDGLPFEKVNLNGALPYRDESFDAVVCANALHRLYNVRGALEEFRRVLRPGGRLYITVNNYASIDRRLRFLFYGSIDNAVNRAGCRQTIDDPEAHIRNHLLFPQLANLLDAAGFRIESVRPSAVRPTQILLSPLAWLIRAASWLVPPRSRRRSRVGAANSGGLFPGGRYFFLEAVKPSSAESRTGKEAAAEALRAG